MKKVAFLAVVALFGLVATGSAQQNAAWNLLDSPVKVEAETSSAGEVVACSALVGGGTASLFEVDNEGASSPDEFLGNELFGSFRVFHTNELCAVLSTFTLAFPGTTATGLAWDHLAPATLFCVDAFSTGTIIQFSWPAGTPTGTSTPLAAGFPGVWGPLAIDRNVAGKIGYCEDIAADVVVQYNLVTDAVGCSFSNPDNGSGSGAYGNGLSPAAVPAGGGGKTLVVASGLITEGQVTRASQMDCTGMGAYGSWDIATPTGPSGEFFVNGIDEYSSAAYGGVALNAFGNVTGLQFIITQTVGIGDCQGKDAPDSNVVYVNASQGGGDFSEPIVNTNPLGLAIQLPPAGGNGKYVVHMDSGTPSSGTITALPASLGSTCFPFLIPPFGAGAPVSVWNNIGKTERVGASNYFGTPIANPAKAPAFFHTDANGDPVNLPGGSNWTLQGIIINPTASSPKGASVTNAVIMAL